MHNVRNNLDLVNELRRIVGSGESRECRISIPQIAVMGDQSSGKSSVLEAISRVPFPKGSTTTTRCAMQLSMKQGEKWNATVRTSNDEKKVAAKTIADPNEMPDLLETVMGDLIKEGEEFCHDEYVIVELEDPESPELTLIDIPGLVSAAKDGQDDSIVEQSVRFVEEYLKDEGIACLYANKIQYRKRVLIYSCEWSKCLHTPAVPSPVT